MIYCLLGIISKCRRLIKDTINVPGVVQNEKNENLLWKKCRHSHSYLFVFVTRGNTYFKGSCLGLQPTGYEHLESNDWNFVACKGKFQDMIEPKMEPRKIRQAKVTILNLSKAISDLEFSMHIKIVNTVTHLTYSCEFWISYKYKH